MTPVSPPADFGLTHVVRWGSALTWHRTRRSGGAWPRAPASPRPAVLLETRAFHGVVTGTSKAVRMRESGTFLTHASQPSQLCLV